jgi:hypothetical protein
MGIEPGPRLGRILEGIHDRILAGEITTHDQALAAARTLFDEQEPTLDGTNALGGRAHFC